MFAELRTKDVLIFGCGNVLFGDDGFGPAVVEELEKTRVVPSHAHAEDVGTSIKALLVDIAFADRKPKCVIVVDAVDKPGHTAGEVFEITPDEIPSNKLADFSAHGFPSSNLLKELSERHGVAVRIVVAQVNHLPTEVSPGLSEPILRAVPAAARRVVEIAEAYGPHLQERSGV